MREGRGGEGREGKLTCNGLDSRLSPLAWKTLKLNKQIEESQVPQVSYRQYVSFLLQKVRSVTEGWPLVP